VGGSTPRMQSPHKGARGGGTIVFRREENIVELLQRSCGTTPTPLTLRSPKLHHGRWMGQLMQDERDILVQRQFG
jgi:hypothetical protein